MPGREYQPMSGYRYGFQNQEKDIEIYGDAISFKYRIEEARLGRFLSIDPLSAKYPYNSPYAFSENRIIDAIELEGLEKVELKDLGSNATKEINQQGASYTVKIGLGDNQQTFSGVKAIERDGRTFLDLTPHLNGKGLYWSSVSGFTTFNIGAGSKISIDDNIFSPPTTLPGIIPRLEKLLIALALFLEKHLHSIALVLLSLNIRQICF